MQEIDVAIVGSGFSGLAMAVLLQKAGHDSFAIFEKGNDVGGTWRENTYPGATCDVPSHLYSYSFEPNATWTRAFSSQKEIWDYLRRVADKYDLRRKIEFCAKVERATWEEESARWRIETANGRCVLARAIVLATGALHVPAHPEIEGLEKFRGPRFHSAEWDHAVDLRNKRVAVLGTGASAIQFVPQIQPIVEKLQLFQRTPPWVMPKPDHAISERARALYARFPALQQLVRKAIYWQLEWRVLGFVHEPRILKLAEHIAVRHMRQSVSDPELQKKLVPDYRMGCKRILISNDYYPAIAKPNVDVVTDPIERIEERGVRTQNGLYEVDAILCGTGFRVSEYLSSIDIRGAGGIDLDSAWKSRNETYLGITVSGFPNLFLMMGPNTGLGHNSMIFMIEAQARYALACIEMLKEKKISSMNVRADVQGAYNTEIQDRSSRTVWTSGCVSWYQGKDGRNLAIWPASTASYWLRTRKVKPGDYELRP